MNRKKKIRKHRGLIITPITLAKISRKLKSQELHEGLIKNEETFPLTEVDGLTKIYKTNRDGEIYEITCVSLEIKITTCKGYLEVDIDYSFSDKAIMA